MAYLKKFDYDSPTGKFTIFAPLKHGTRWLEHTATKFSELNISDRRDFSNDLSKILFSSKQSPFVTNKIAVGNFKKEIIVPEPCFVYRDPYEWFISAIRTGAATVYKDGALNPDHFWNAEMGELDTLMIGNGHYIFNYWRKIYELIKDHNRNDIKLISMNELSRFVRVRTLTYYPFNKENFAFSAEFVRHTPFGDETYDLIGECKARFPELWSVFMKEIEEENKVLGMLIANFKWQGNIL